MAVTVLRQVCSVGGHNIVNHVLQDDLEYPNHVTSEPYSAILFLPFPNLCLLFLFLTSLSISLSLILWFFIGVWLVVFVFDGKMGKNMKNSMVLICSRSDGARFNDLWVWVFSKFWWIWAIGLCWWCWAIVHCSSFFLLVFTLIFSSCFHLCSTDLGLSYWVAGFVFLWWVWVLGYWVWFGKNTKNML